MGANEPFANLNWEQLQSRRDFLELMAKTSLLAAVSPLVSSCASTGNLIRINSVWENEFEITEDDKMGQMKEIVRYATLAPSGHNTQPWKFSIEDNSIRIFPDFTRQLPVVDPDHRELYISLGCALENLVIAARYAGYDSEVEYFPTAEPTECLLVNLKRFKTAENNILFQAIPERHTNRREYNGQQIPTADLNKLESVPKEEGITSLVLTESKIIEQIIELVKEGNEIQMNDDAFMDELISWIRFSDAEAEKHRDGLTSRAMGRSPVPGWLG
ncbi:MAG TPA: Tat pathway signal protein, partial [Candidatus Latescibacteria bacterium]|nr:Tat pathway signal protein [Candidatus Latescibacterota bacterium]